MSKAAKAYAEKTCPYLETDPYAHPDEVSAIKYENIRIDLQRGIAERAYDQGVKDTLEKVCQWLRDSVTIDKQVETNEDGEPLALSYIDYAMERLKVANEVVDEFMRRMAEMD